MTLTICLRWSPVTPLQKWPKTALSPPYYCCLGWLLGGGWGLFFGASKITLPEHDFAQDFALLIFFYFLLRREKEKKNNLVYNIAIILLLAKGRSSFESLNIFSTKSTLSAASLCKNAHWFETFCKMSSCCSGNILFSITSPNSKLRRHHEMYIDR